MKIKRFLIFLLILPSFFLYASEKVFFSLSSDLASSYVFRGLTPADRSASTSINFSAFFPKTNLNLSQWFVNSLKRPFDYHESGTMLSYHYYFSDELIGSAGMTLYLLPGVAQTPLANTEVSLTLAHVGFKIPYFIESYYDFVLKSLYLKLSAGYTIDTFLPLNLSLSAGVNCLEYSRFSQTVPTGLSDMTLSLYTYVSLNNWQISPNLSLFFLNSSNTSILVQAKINLNYSF